MNMEDKMKEVFKHPVTAQVFSYLRKMNKPVGVREVMKELKLGSSSTSHYHLKKLNQIGVVKQNSNNSYQLSEPFNLIKEIPLPVILNHYLIGGNFYPNMLLVIVFQIVMFIGIFVLLSLDKYLEAAFSGLLALLISIILLFRFFKNVY